MTATAGAGPDALEPTEFGHAQMVQDDGVILRLVNALNEKRKKGDEYRERGWLHASDPYLIAVNSGDVPDGKAELQLPRIVRTVFPFGNEFVYVDPETMEVTGGGHQLREAIKKRSGNPVFTRCFEDPQFDGVAGALYSIADAFNPVDDLRWAACLVMNPRANAPLPDQFQPDLWTFWREGQTLKWRRPGDPPRP